MRVLVVGRSGQVGRELARAAWPSTARLHFVDLPEFDVSDAAAVHATVRRFAPDVVVNASAYTAVDRAETDVARAEAVNTRAPGYLAAACARADAALVHISTDYVFDGEKRSAYLEDDATCPLGVYGRTKAAGEREVRAVLARHVTLRTSWVYAAHGANFVRTMLRLSGEREQLSVVDDQHGAPTSAADVARGCVAAAMRLLTPGFSGFGTVHFTAQGETTWFGFASAIFEQAGARLARRPQLRPISTAEYPLPARRPRNSLLDCSRAERILGLSQRPWQAGLRDVLGELL